MKYKRLLILLLFFNAPWVDAQAQKNMIAADTAGLVGIRLPKGSKQDKRLLSVSAAGMMLDMEGERLKTKLKGTEVYYIPPASGFNADSLSTALRQTGWKRVEYEEEPGYSLWQKEKKFALAYIEKAKKETSVYMSECLSVPNTKSLTGTAGGNPVANTQQGQRPINTGNPSPAVLGKPVSSPILGTWIKTSSVHYSYDNPSSLTTAGYVSSQYTLMADGTYTYFSKFVSNASAEIMLVREYGLFTIAGNQLEIKPQTSNIESWSRKNNTDKYGTMLRSQQRKIENVTYTFTEHYFSGIQEWNLVLQAPKPTDREGPFSANTTFPNAWYFRRPAVNSAMVDLPEQQ